MGKYFWSLFILIIGCEPITSSTSEYKAGRERLNQLLDSSMLYIDSEKYHKASLYLDTAEILATKYNDSLSLSSVWNNYGEIYELRGEFLEGLSFYEKSLEIDQSLNDSSRIGRRLKNIGICYRQLGLHEKSLTAFLESLTIFNNQSNFHEISSIENAIGNLYNTLKEFEKSKIHLERARQLWTEIKDFRRASIAENNLANALLGQDSVLKAIDLYQIVLRKKRNLGHQYSISITLNNLGEAFIKNDQIEEAQKSFEEALQIRELMNNSKGAATVLNNLAALFLIQDDIQKAENFILKAISVFMEFPLNEEFVKTLSIQKAIQIRKAEFKKAFITDHQLDSLRIVVFENEKVNTINLMSVYERDVSDSKRIRAEQESRLKSRLNQQQKNIIGIITGGLLLSIILLYIIHKSREREKRQNALLNKKNEEIVGLNIRQQEQNTLLEEKKKEVEELNAELKTLLDDSYHRKRNDFNRLLSIIEYIADKIPEVKELLGPVNHVITTTFDLDDFLEVDDSMVTVNLSDHLKALLSRLQKKHDMATLGLQVEINCEPVALDTKTVIGLSYIICELFNNTMKYGIPNNQTPRIILNLKRQGPKLCLEYTDNGDDPDIESKIRNSTGMGWGILNKFAKSINATIVCERSRGLTIFSFKIENAFG